MSKFAYNGDHSETVVFGLLFPQGEPVEVTDEKVISKLRNNREFSEFFDGVEVLDAEPVKRGPGRPRKAE